VPPTLSRSACSSASFWTDDKPVLYNPVEDSVDAGWREQLWVAEMHSRLHRAELESFWVREGRSSLTEVCMVVALRSVCR
jgi:hypothetical protein